MKSNQQTKRVLIWDIETLPNVAASFGVWKQNISPAAIMNTSSLICASWKWLGEDKVHTLSIADYEGFRKDVFDDRALVKDLKEVLLQADILVHHNGDNFDVKYFNGRLLANGFTALPRIQTIDTYKVAKNKFRINFNRLDYLADLLGIEGKHKIDMSVWLAIIQGKKSAVRYMEKYNRQDVLILEKIYDKLLSYIPTHPDLRTAGNDRINCPICQGKLLLRGFHYTKTAKKQRYCCKGCGSWSTGKRSLEVSEVRSV